MPLISKPNYNQIFASQAPEQDKPAVFNNYPGGWGVESRPNNGKPTIKGFNYLQQTSDLKDLWILQNGACLPYDESIEYAEGAPVLKDGVIQYKTAGGFNRIATPKSFYETLAEANADIENIEVNQAVNIGEVANGGLWYKATAGATILTKSPYDPLTQAEEYTSNYVGTESLNLFKREVYLGYSNNMPVRRYTAESTFNDYTAGTYQTLSGSKVQLSVPASGSAATTHYFETGIAAQPFEAEFTVTLKNSPIGVVGVGFKNNGVYSMIGLSNTGNLASFSGYSSVILETGLGNYDVGDTVKFIYDGTNVKAYVNNVFRAEAPLTQNGTIIVGQSGFSQFLSMVSGGEFDPIRDYVKDQIADIPTPDPNVLPQAKQYTEAFVADKSLDLFKQEVEIPYSNNMPVRRYTGSAAFNDYAAGTYQTLSGDKVELAVVKSGSAAIKHYFITLIDHQEASFELTVNSIDSGTDSIGIGFLINGVHTVITYSASGSVRKFVDYDSPGGAIASNLGNVIIGDKLRFDYANNEVAIYLNDTLKIKTALVGGGVFIIGQGGFGTYSSIVSGATIDPIRDYVQAEISSVAGGGLSPCYYSYDSATEIFSAYTKVKNNLYVGFEVRHEVDMSESVYLDYWRLYQAMFYTFESGVMTNTGKYAIIGGENEFVFRQNSTKDDFTGGYHGDELVTDIKLMVDGFPISTSSNIPLTAANRVEYIEKSTMHETSSDNVIVEGHPIVAYHTKHTKFKDGGYKTWNKAIWNYQGTMSTLYHGISCISKDVATAGFSDDTFTDQAFTGSDANYFTAIGTRLFKGRNTANGLAVEATSEQIKVSGADESSEFFVKDRTTDSKYYRKSPAKVVEVGEIHESYFKCRFFAI